jgi:hypothetical protein
MNPEDISFEIVKMEDRLKQEGLRPVRWNGFPPKEGCRSCGDEKRGPWIVTLMYSRMPEIGKGLIFIATLCKTCLETEECCDEVCEAAAQAYIIESSGLNN